LIPKAIIYPTHDWLIDFAGGLAVEMKRRHGIHSVVLLQGTKDALRARRMNVFDEIVDIAQDLQLSQASTHSAENLRTLARLEQDYAQLFVWQAIIQDRHWRIKRYSYSEVLEYMGHTVRLLESVFSRWEILAGLGELTWPCNRLVYQMCGTHRPYFIPMTARFFDRIYFDDDMYLRWRECIRTYQRFMRDGVPENTSAIIDPVIRGIREARITTVLMEQNVARAAQYSGLQKVRPGVWALTSTDIWFNNVIDGRKNPQGLHWSYWLPPRRIARWAEWTFRRWYYHRNALSKIPQNTRFALFLPHWQPEYTIDVQGWPFVDQASLIRNVAQSLPADMLLLVKEHRFMLGPRSLELYRRSLDLPNVRLIHENTNSQDLVRAAEIVFTVTGTVALEALCYAKPVIMFGRVFLNEFQGVKVVRDLYSLPAEIESSLKGDFINYDQSARAAFAAMYVCSYSGRIDDPRIIPEENQTLVGAALEMELQKRGILPETSSGKLLARPPAASYERS
jgi:hypothetical protein